MFNNFINIHDFTRVLWGLKHGYLPKIISRLSKGKAGRVKEAWKKVPQKPSSWWVIPEVGRHCKWGMIELGGGAGTARILRV